MKTEQKVSGRTVIGKVISNKMDKTIIVEVERKVMHPLYGKYIRKVSTICAHDDDNSSNLGDVVEIKMCRPLSKTKSWQLVQVLSQVGKEDVA